MPLLTALRQAEDSAPDHKAKELGEPAAEFWPQHLWSQQSFSGHISSFPCSVAMTPRALGAPEMASDPPASNSVSSPLLSSQRQDSPALFLGLWE